MGTPSKLYIVTIGIDTYNDEQIPILGCAVNDAKAIGQVFREGLAEEYVEVIELLNESANLGTVKHIIGEQIANKSTEDDAIVIFYAGHGAREIAATGNYKEGAVTYLLPSDARVDSLYSTAFSLNDDLPVMMKRISADNVLIVLDCCFSGGGHAPGANVRGIDGPKLKLSKLVSSTTAYSASVGKGNVTFDLGIGRSIMMACTQGQSALEYPDLGHGVFTYYLLQHLRAGLQDNTPVPIAVLHHETATSVARHTNMAQTPILEGRLHNQQLFAVIDKEKPA